MTPEIENAEKTKYVGFWVRMLAFTIDSIAATLVLTPLSLRSGSAILGDMSDPAALQDALMQSLPGALLESLLVAVLFIGFWIYFASTPGKLLVKSYIVDAKTHSRAKTSQLVIRYFGYFVSLIPLGLGFIWIAFDPKKQGFHDKLASTVVIYEKPSDE